MRSKGISPVVATVLLMGIAVATVSSAAVFLQDTIDNLQKSAEGKLSHRDKMEMSSISIDYGLNGTNGYLLLDVRNDGSRTIDLVRRSSPLFNMYVNGVPESWSFISGSPRKGKKEVSLNPNSVVTINTTEVFPSDGNSKEVEFFGPYGMRSTYVCYSENGACES